MIWELKSLCSMQKINHAHLRIQRERLFTNTKCGRNTYIERIPIGLTKKDIDISNCKHLQSV